MDEQAQILRLLLCAEKQPLLPDWWCYLVQSPVVHLICPAGANGSVNNIVVSLFQP
jgi:hypothetical protein